MRPPHHDDSSARSGAVRSPALPPPPELRQQLHGNDEFLMIPAASCSESIMSSRSRSLPPPRLGYVWMIIMLWQRYLPPPAGSQRHWRCNGREPPPL